MTRTVSTAIALTLGVSVLAAVAATVFAQKNQAGSAASRSQDLTRTSGSAASQVGTLSSESAALQPGTQQLAPVVAQVQTQQTRSDDAAEDNPGRSIRSGSLSISASEKTNPDLIQEEKIPEIEVDSSNIRTVGKSSAQPIRESKRELPLTSARKESSLAEKLLDANAANVQIWRPAYSTQGFRGARLDAFAISDDASVLAIAERTGTSAGPNGSRVILIDTSNWQVIRIFTTDLMLKKIAFGPTSGALAAVAFPQASRKQNFGVALFDLKNGKQTAFYALPFPFNGNPASEQIALLTSPDGVFCSGFFGSKVFFIPLNADASAELPYSTFETVSPASALALTPDGKSVAAASLKAIEYFTNFKTGATRRGITTLDLGWAPVDLHFLGGAQTDFILCPAFREDSPPVIVHSSARESLDGRSAGFAIPMGNNSSQIGVAFKVKGRIDIVDPASLEAVDSVIMDQRPETAGNVQFVFYLEPIHAFCAIDTTGNCFAVGKMEGAKHWSKRIIWNGGGKR